MNFFEAVRSGVDTILQRNLTLHVDRHSSKYFLVSVEDDFCCWLLLLRYFSKVTWNFTIATYNEVMVEVISELMKY